MESKLIFENVLSSESIADLKTLKINNMPNLLILVSPLAGVSSNAAVQVSQLVLEEESYDFDFLHLTPESGKWSVSEIQSDLIAGSLRVPSQRNFIVVEDADEMDIVASDKLLKTIEEPYSPTSFIFCVKDISKVSATMRSRAGVTMHLKVASIEERAQKLTKLTGNEEKARQCVSLAGDQVSLAPVIALNEELFIHAINAWGDFKIVKPAKKASKVIDSLNALANALLNPESSVNLNLKPNAKPAQKVLFTHTLKVYEEQAVKAALNSGNHASAVKVLQAAKSAREQVGAYTPQFQVLTSFYLKITGRV